MYVDTTELWSEKLYGAKEKSETKLLGLKILIQMHRTKPAQKQANFHSKIVTSSYFTTISGMDPMKPTKK